MTHWRSPIHGHPPTLRTSGLTLDEAVTRLARGQVLGLGYEDPSWPAVARESLSLIFPALLLSAGFRYASRILRRPHDGLRLFTLPGQRQAREIGLLKPKTCVDYM